MKKKTRKNTAQVPGHHDVFKRPNYGSKMFKLGDTACLAEQPKPKLKDPLCPYCKRPAIAANPKEIIFGAEGSYHLRCTQPPAIQMDTVGEMSSTQFNHPADVNITRK